MDTVNKIVEIIYLAISAVGVIVVIWGVVEVMFSFLILKFSIRKNDAISESENIRQRLGAYLLLGLEIFIGADIISSVVSPTWQKVGILASFVGIRTV